MKALALTVLVLYVLAATVLWSTPGRRYLGPPLRAQVRSPLGWLLALLYLGVPVWALRVLGP